jgi:hypothetical protein
VNWEHEVTNLLQQYVVPATSVVGTIVVALYALTQHSKVRMENEIEATATWRDLAQSRDASITDLKQKLASRDRRIIKLERRLEFLWKQVDADTKSALLRGRLMLEDHDD